MWQKQLLSIAITLSLVTGASLLDNDQQPTLQEEHAQDAEASDHALSWLEGNWSGKGLGGKVQEVWLAPEGGVMLGVFRLVTGGKPNFYELVTITEKDGEFTMALKHFHANLNGWEAKDESLQWEGSEMSESRVRFGPVLYELDKEGKLHAWVELGEDNTEHLVFTKSK